MTPTARCRTYHLLRDFGVYKATLKRAWENSDTTEPGIDADGALFRRKSQCYTLPEIERLFFYLLTAHDACVLEETGVFSAVEVYGARQKERAYDRAMKKLAEARAKEEAE